MPSVTAGEVLGYRAPAEGETVRLPVMLLDSDGAAVTGVTYDAAGMTVMVKKEGGSAFSAFPTFGTDNWDEIGYGLYEVIIRGSDADELALLDTPGALHLYVKTDATRGDVFMFKVNPADVTREDVWTDAKAGYLDVAVSSRGTYSGTPPSASQIADQVWDEAQADHVAAGTTGKSLSDAGAAGDPWATALPGSYAAGTAGYRVGTLLDAQLSTVGGTITLAAASDSITVDASGEAVGSTGNITMARKASATIAFTATGKNLTGHSLYITCREDRADLTDATDATALFSKACIVTSATTFSVTLTATETDKLTTLGKPYWYEIRDVTAQDSLIIARLTVVGSVVKRTS